MEHNSQNGQEFLARLTKLVEANLSDENFGVSELARVLMISRSNLYLKVKSATGKSTSQFIREIRLNKALKLLQQTDQNVSEVAYKVGFGSPTYFNTCFHEHFGYPPGEAKKHIVLESDSVEDLELLSQTEKTKNQKKWIFAITLLIILPGMYFLFFINSSGKRANDLSEKSIIVLPFKNLSTDPSNQYFADGISEDILNQLTKISDLKVVSRTSAERFRESSLSTTEIAKKMDVGYMLEGSVRRQGDNVRLIVQLIDARNDQHLWSENYDRQLEDIFTIQNDISKNIADQLQSILSSEEIRQIEKRQPTNTEAYDNYLMGRYFCFKRDVTSIYKGIEYFNKALKIDPDYALAYAGLTDGYNQLSFLGKIERNKGYALAYEMAEKALAKDSTLAETYATFGAINCYGYWKWEEARKLFKRALEIDPNCIMAHIYYCGFLDIVGEPNKALEHVNRAIELDPFINSTYQMKGVIYRNEKQYQESNEAFSTAFAMNPEKLFCPWSIFKNYIDLNDEESAVKMIIEIFSKHSEYKSYIDSITPVYETSGINGILNLYLDAILINETSTSLLEGKIPNIASEAYLYNKLGMQEEALSMLELACREKFCDIPRRIRMPEFDNLHSNPRFLALVDTMNLTLYFPKPGN